MKEEMRISKIPQFGTHIHPSTLTSYSHSAYGIKTSTVIALCCITIDNHVSHRQICLVDLWSESNGGDRPPLTPLTRIAPFSHPYCLRVIAEGRDSETERVKP